MREPSLSPSVWKRHISTERPSDCHCAWGLLVPHVAWRVCSVPPLLVQYVPAAARSRPEAGVVVVVVGALEPPLSEPHATTPPSAPTSPRAARPTRPIVVMPPLSPAARAPAGMTGRGRSV